MLKSVNRPSERTEFAYVVDVRSQRESEFQKKKKELKMKAGLIKDYRDCQKSNAKKKKAVNV